MGQTEGFEIVVEVLYVPLGHERHGCSPEEGLFHNAPSFSSFPERFRKHVSKVAPVHSSIQLQLGLLQNFSRILVTLVIQVAPAGLENTPQFVLGAAREHEIKIARVGACEPDGAAAQRGRLVLKTLSAW